VPLRSRQQRLACEVLDLSGRLDRLADAPGLPEVANEVPGWQELIHRAGHHLGDPTSLAQRMGPMRLRVAVVGRTESGKSTLINAMLGEVVAKVGAGHQRTTRRSTTYRMSELVDLVDTPGVAAVDGREDEAWAASSASFADLVIYLLSSDHLSGQEAAKLSHLDEIDHSCVLVLNMKRDIDGRRKGRDLQAQRARFLRDPESIFVPNDIDSHVRRVAEVVPRLWDRSGGRVLAIHAQAAMMACEGGFGDDAPRLREASRVEDLLRELGETARRDVPTFRVAEITQPYIIGAERAAQDVATLKGRLQSAQSELETAEKDVRAGIDALIDDHTTRFHARVSELLAPLRDDLDEIARETDIGKVHARWERRMSEAAIVEEFERSLAQLADELADALRSPVPTEEGVVWHPPEIRFDLSIDVTGLFIDAFLEGAQRAGVKALTRVVLKRIATRAAASSAGGPWAVALYMFVEALRMARGFQVGFTEARRQKREELRRLLRNVIDATVDALPRQFRQRVATGEFGTAIQGHTSSLRDAALMAQELSDACVTSLEAIAASDASWADLQLSTLQSMDTRNSGGWRVRSRDDGGLVITCNGRAPWAAVVRFERATGRRVSFEHTTSTQTDGAET
jgi:energy-coupling factor transporter ATP-binding protein EcfA2